MMHIAITAMAPAMPKRSLAKPIRRGNRAPPANPIVSVALVGAKPCEMDAYDYVIHVPSTETPRIQECQTLIGHILCGAVEQSLFADNN